MTHKINVYSEIGKLRSIILHRPGNELMNITPDLMGKLLFDELPFLEAAQREHDRFAQVLRENGVEVQYIENLAAEAITDEEIKSKLINDFIYEAGIKAPRERTGMEELLHSYNDPKELILKMIEGTMRNELPHATKKGLHDTLQAKDLFVAMPMPNLYFTRDTFALIGNGVCMNSMWSFIRQRETIFGDLVFKHHPMFRDEQVPFWYEKTNFNSLEGGDIIVLSDKVVAVGSSQRTEPRSIEIFAENLLNADNDFETVLCFVLPNQRACMHLDTVFTMVDRDLFTVFPGIENTLEVYSLTLKDGEVVTSLEPKGLEEVLSKYLKVDHVKMIRQGHRGLIDATREQWSDGYNTLAIAPREVVVYERNQVINELLDKAGAKLHVISSGELSRGRGGPRCMSMPLFRESL